MLAKSRRLRLTRDFEHVFAQGRVFAGKYFKIRVVSNNKLSTRFAVVVSNKVSKKAVLRNRIRRRAWSTISKINLLVSGNKDIAIIAMPEALKADFTGLFNELVQLLTKKISTR